MPRADDAQFSWSGEPFSIESAKIWDLPERPIEIGVAVLGTASVGKFSALADHFIAVEPDGEIVRLWADARKEARLSAGRRIGQIPVCWGPDKQAAVATAHELFRWFGGGWHVNANLPTPAAFAAASQYVTPDDVADSIACGPDLDELAESVRPFLDAEAAGPLLDRLRAL